jgi:hypothetical protein
VLLHWLELCEVEDHAEEPADLLLAS